MGDIVLEYSKWHYGRAPKEFVVILKNFLLFLLHFFSFKLLLQTFFHPWRRMQENYSGGFNLGALASSLLVNSIMRCVGLVSRVCLLGVGLVTLILALVLGIFLILFWFVSPIFILGSIVAGISLMI